MAEDLNSAVTAAIESAKADEGGGSAAGAAADDAAGKETAANDEGAAATGTEGKETKSAADEEEDFWAPTADELAEIEKNPALQKVYKSMQRGFTKKTSELAQIRKSADEAIKVAEFIQANPVQAARNLAKATGLTIAEAKEVVAEAAAGRPTDAGQIKAVAEGLEKRWAESVSPEAAKLLRPLFEDTAKTIVEQMVGPIIQQLRDTAQRTEGLESTAVERAITSSVKSFGARQIEAGNEWDDDLQGEMAELMSKVQPAEGASIDDFLDILYDKALAGRTRSTQNRQRLERLRRIRDNGEPTTTARPGASRTADHVTADMSDNDAIALAVKQATREASGR